VKGRVRGRWGRGWREGLSLAALWLGVTVCPAVGQSYDWPGKLTHVARGLDSPLVKDRVAALRGLALFAPVDVAPLLRKALDDESVEVRVVALEGLRTKGSVEDIPRLMSFVNAANDEERLGGVRALGQLGDRTAVDPLTRALGDPSPEIREAAVRALGRLGYADGVPGVTTLLHDPEVPVVLASIDVLASSGDTTAVFAILEKTKDPNLRVQVEALAAIGRLGDRRAVKPLTGMLYVEQREVRTAVIDALGQLADRDATPHLLKLMWELHDTEVGGAVLRALGRLGDPRAIGPLLQLLRYSSAAPGAADALKQLGPAVVPAVLEVLRDPSEPLMVERCLGVLAWVARRDVGASEATRQEVAERVVAGLDQQRFPLEASLPALLATERPVASRALLRHYADLLDGAGDPELDNLRPRYEQAPDLELRRQLVAGLAAFDDGGMVTPLLDLYPRMTDAERSSALAIFGRFKSPEALPHVIEALRKGAGDQPLAAARALGAYGDAPAGLALAERLRTAEGALLFEVGYALGRCPVPRVTDALWALATESTGRRKAVAISVLGDHLRAHPRPEIQATLLDWLDDEPEGPSAELIVPVVTVGAPTDAVVARLLAVYDDTPVPVKVRILQGLGAWRTKAAAALLRQAAASPHAALRAEAALGLGRLGVHDGESLALLLPLLSDTDQAVQLNAAAALVWLSDAALAEELRGRLEDVRGDARANLLLALGRADAAPGPRELQRLAARSTDDGVVRAAYRVAAHRRTVTDLGWLELERRRAPTPRSRALLDHLLEVTPWPVGDRWTRYVFADDDGPMVGQRAIIVLPDGVAIARTSDRGGEIRVEHEPGVCLIQTLDDTFRTGP